MASVIEQFFTWQSSRRLILLHRHSPYECSIYILVELHTVFAYSDVSNIYYYYNVELN